jgi:hypothetical protein
VPPDVTSGIALTQSLAHTLPAASMASAVTFSRS